jgi:hypothetical protein
MIFPREFQVDLQVRYMPQIERIIVRESREPCTAIVATTNGEQELW